MLFDPDGTEVDWAPDLAAATNELLGADDLPPQSPAAVRGGCTDIAGKDLAANLAIGSLAELSRAIETLRQVV